MYLIYCLRVIWFSLLIVLASLQMSIILSLSVYIFSGKVLFLSLFIPEIVTLEVGSPSSAQKIFRSVHTKQCQRGESGSLSPKLSADKKKNLAAVILV